MATGPRPPYNSAVPVWTREGRISEFINNQGIEVNQPPSGFGILGDTRPTVPSIAERKNSTRPGGVLGAWSWSCTAWQKEETRQEDIIMLINPENVGWTIPFRQSRVNTFGGTIFHRWQNLNRSPVDLPALRVRMNTGNIFPASRLSTATLSGQRVEFRPLDEEERRRVFFRFCSLAYQPAFVSGEPNIVSVTYRSVLIGEVHLFVVFSEPLMFTEDAMKPFNVQYEIGLTVIGQNPEFTSPDQFLTSIGR